MNRQWHDVLRNPFRHRRGGLNRGRRPTAKPELECLEGRVTPTVSLVKDINPLGVPAQGSSPRNMVTINGTLFFTANDGVHGEELWRSDGTEAGTALVNDTFLG